MTIPKTQGTTRIYELSKYGIKLNLDNITAFLTQLGNPQLRFKTIHVAGSNGKGSTASFIASMLMEAGMKTGLYTSPHFVSFNERIRIDRCYIPDTYIGTFLDEHFAYLYAKKMTYFEAATALAFKYFADEQVDAAVIETGLGGRLDATNILASQVQVITSVSKEHTEYLGDTIEKIAAEKAGIIKKNSVCVTGNLPSEAKQVVAAACAVNHTKLISFEESNRRYANLLYAEALGGKFPLRGDYQINNAVTAIAAFKEFCSTKDNEIISRGIRNVLVNTNLQGRFEFIHHTPDIIMDSAHNPEGMNAFVSELKKTRHTYKHMTVLFAAMKDKAVQEMISVLKRCFDAVVLTTLEMERAMQKDQLLKICERDNIVCQFTDNPGKFVKQTIAEKNTDCLVITGSMYLLGSIKAELLYNHTSL